MRWCGSFISPIAHITFCTLDEVLRPQILIMACPLAPFVIAGLVTASRGLPDLRHITCETRAGPSFVQSIALS
jgi:hypothetical protein